MLDSWRRLRRDPDFHAGAREMAGIALGIGAWGLVTGVAMVKSGLGVPLSLLMTLTVFAGSAQLSALPLIAAGAPIWVVWATAACVNLRFVIFSAGWRPYFAHLPRRQRLLMGYVSGDLNYVCFMRRYPEPVPAPGQLAYYWGGVAVNWCAWQAMSILGIVLADQVPTEWGLGFAGTLALLGLTGSLLTDRATWIAAAVAACAAVAAYALPLRLNIVVAIAAAVAVGIVLDHWKPAQRPGAA
ncbi:AzlC family ABC transporter permease [Ideonella sp. 4Y16]|uniref:AzlC family ABC transporter permease n=2 Tax=Ideonella TaxID=36862 RepID=A0A940YNL3_9BURK|nr:MULTISPECIES: AzlC family ABC transporter permease [Ideonella]MBQ0932771.1 AzlC family ABC transporter permease [Ideonella alba]MBQ0946033.1 AzlC family ABC transporter permease [Ideonella alba]MBQ0959228.1 AzlC family ABC transporter permease [Ideonella aquatica]